MSDLTLVLLGISLPLAGTTLGAGCVFFAKSGMRPAVQKFLLGFASGVMIAASIWSLLIPAIEMTGGRLAFVPAAVGFLVGIAFLLLLDCVVPHLHVNAKEPEGRKSSLGKSLMLVLAVTLHNLPEGMAVGVVLAGLLGGSGITAASAFALAAGIAIQNFPEGAIISLPLAGEGMPRGKAFLCGFGSGVVEPVGALITIALTRLVTPVLPYILSFAAGAMLYVVIEELIPESQNGKHSNLGTIGAALGFVLMMVLDVALG